MVWEGQENPEWVFCSEDGNFMNEYNFRTRKFYPLFKKEEGEDKSLELHQIRLHDLRHSYASLMLQQGESVTYVKEQMGHHSIQVTVRPSNRWRKPGSRQSPRGAHPTNFSNRRRRRPRLSLSWGPGKAGLPSRSPQNPPHSQKLKRRVIARQRVSVLLFMNWDAGIRTPISRSRVCGPTVGRRPKKESNQLSSKGYHILRIRLL
jgi:hypothetical protein